VRVVGRIDVRKNLRRIRADVVQPLPQLHGDRRIKLHLPEPSNNLLGFFCSQLSELSRRRARAGNQLEGGSRIGTTRRDRFRRKLEEGNCTVIQ